MLYSSCFKIRVFKSASPATRGVSWKPAAIAHVGCGISGKITLCFFLTLSVLGFQSVFAQDAGFQKPTKILLVGVANYPNSEFASLPGTQNDIELFSRLFIDKMGVSESGIVILSDTAGANNPDCYPTRVNIEREFKKLAETANENDFIFILMSGHGSQVPELKDVSSHERYGKDSVFLPRDTGRWDGGTVPNCIRDHEIGLWIHDIRKKNAFVWYVADSCHSGGGTRGVFDDETARSISPLQLGIPQNAFIDSLDIAEQMGKTSEQELQYIPANVAFFASLPTQQTLSKYLPPEVPKEERTNYGIFSYCLCKSLERIVDAEIQTSYDELIKAIELQYASLPIYSRTPTPLSEGSDVSLAVLQNRPVERNLTIRFAPETQHLNVGLFHGIGGGSILEVFDRIGSEQKSLGFIKVEHESLYSSVAVPVEWNDVPATEEFPKRPLRCEPAVVQAGIDPEIKIAFDPSKDAYTGLKQLLFVDDNKPFRFTEATVEEADFLLRDTGHIVSKAEIVAIRSPLKMLPFGQFGGQFDITKDDFAETLHENFHTIAFAHYLLKIADRSERINRTMTQAGIDPLNQNSRNPVTVELTLFQTETPDADINGVWTGSETNRLSWIRKNMTEFPIETNRLINLEDGDSLALVAKNIGYNEAWFNVITIDKDCNLASHYHSINGDNSISTDEEASCILSFYSSNDAKADSDIVIVVLTSEKIDLNEHIESDLFSLLASTKGSKTKGRGTTSTGYFIMKVFPVITGSANPL